MAAKGVAVERENLETDKCTKSQSRGATER